MCVFGPSSEVYSCSLDGTVLAWNVSTLEVNSRFQLPCCGLTSISLHSSSLWCCKSRWPGSLPGKEGSLSWLLLSAPSCLSPTLSLGLLTPALSLLSQGPALRATLA